MSLDYTVCGACADTPVSLAPHHNCPGPGEPGPFKGCACARGNHEVTQAVLEYVCKYHPHLSEEQIRERWVVPLWASSELGPDGPRLAAGLDAQTADLVICDKSLGITPGQRVSLEPLPEVALKGVGLL